MSSAHASMGIVLFIRGWKSGSIPDHRDSQFRKMKGLWEAMEKINIPREYILTLDEEGIVEISGNQIEIIPL